MMQQNPCFVLLYLKTDPARTEQPVSLTLNPHLLLGACKLEDMSQSESRTRNSNSTGESGRVGICKIVIKVKERLVSITL